MPSPKLTHEQVAVLRAAKKAGMSIKLLADAFKVSPKTISAIVNKKARRKHAVQKRSSKT